MKSTTLGYLALVLLAFALLAITWLGLGNGHDTFMSDCIPRASVERCQEQWRIREERR